MRIQNNISALNAHRNLTFNNSQTQKSLEKLSSGFRVNRAGDDAAGLAISEKMRAQINGLQVAQKNAQDAISLIQTAEGSLNESHVMLRRMRELAMSSANGVYTDEDERVKLQAEFDSLVEEIERTSGKLTFNGKVLLDGTFKNETFAIDADGGTIAFTINNMGTSNDNANTTTVTIGTGATSKGIKIDVAMDSLATGCISTADAAGKIIEKVDGVISYVSKQRADLGVLQNRLEHTITSLSVAEENLTASESRIRDVDMAKEMMTFTKYNILNQAAQSMLAQANMQPQGVLQLLQ